MVKKGKIYLIPTPLGEDALHTLPAYVLEVIHLLDYFIVEKAKTARRFVKSTKPPKAIQELIFFELDKHDPHQTLNDFLKPAEAGNDIGVLSEAGCPGVADPGAEIVKIAHRKGLEIIPLVGPSSILLALMASGMSGQQFCFQGYLSPKKPALEKDLKRLEQFSSKFNQTQIFIETPYRNNALVQIALKILSPNTLFCIAADLTASNQYVVTKKIRNWREAQIPDLHKRPVIYLIFVGKF